MSSHFTPEMLAEARAAYHSLLIGEGVYSFRDQNGEQVSYSRANLNQLAAYIRQMEVALGVGAPVMGPMKVWM